MKLFTIVIFGLLSTSAFAGETQLDQDLSLRLFNSLHIKAVVGRVNWADGETSYVYQKDIDGTDSDIRCNFDSAKLNAKPNDQGSSPVRCFIREFQKGHD